MVDRRIINKWLFKAEEDYKFASYCLEHEMSFYAPICFHFQQSAEKYLKAYVVAFELEFKKTHDLEELIEICKQKDISFESLRSEAKYLSDLYIEPRYPTHWASHYTKKDAKEAQTYTKTIGNFVKKHLTKRRKK